MIRSSKQKEFDELTYWNWTFYIGPQTIAVYLAKAKFNDKEKALYYKINVEFITKWTRNLLYYYWHLKFIILP